MGLDPVVSIGVLVEVACRGVLVPFTVRAIGPISPTFGASAVDLVVGKRGLTLAVGALLVVVGALYVLCTRATDVVEANLAIRTLSTVLAVADEACIIGTQLIAFTVRILRTVLAGIGGAYLSCWTIHAAAAFGVTGTREADLVGTTLSVVCTRCTVVTFAHRSVGVATICITCAVSRGTETVGADLTLGTLFGTRCARRTDVVFAEFSAVLVVAVGGLSAVSLDTTAGETKMSLGALAVCFTRLAIVIDTDLSTCAGFVVVASPCVTGPFVAYLTCGALVVALAGFALAGLCVAYAFGGAGVTVFVGAALTEFAGFVDAQLANGGRTLFVREARAALASSTNKATCAVAVFFACTGLTDFVDALFACGTFVICRTFLAGPLFADKSSKAIVVVDATCAGVVGGVALLILAAIFVYATASFALT